ncbi:Armadillo repeat-containing protein 3 [Rhizophlyctis rosea]|uniref:Armadillo repeat-containing protein 3 n=1 Tax=Rhizophlyctis rosea TaxID=64517 RepID=A0AAD5X5H5_9FUNG|nr:Armadillo repeat-containing protein 3 [Rhizophlyctis rosea]
MAATVGLDDQTMCDTSNFGVTDVRTLILLLASPESSICVGALEALTKYAEGASRHRTQLLQLKILKPVLDLTGSKDPGIKKAAVACLAATSELNDFHPDMRKPELLSALINLLAPEEAPEVQEEAAFAIANLARDFANKADIRKAGGMKALVRLLDLPDPDVKKNVAYALTALLEDFTNRSEIRYVHGLASLLELLSSEYQEIQENALQSLIKCAEDHANRVEIRKLSGVKRLIEFLGQDLPDLHYLTLLCIANCLEESETVNAFPEWGGLAPLVRMLSADDVRLKQNAALALGRAAKIGRNQNYIREAGALPILVTNLSHVDAGVISMAALALAVLANNEINQLELNKLNACEILIRHLSHDDLNVNRNSVAALTSLCLNAKLRPRIRALDGIAAVIKLVQYDDVQVVINACECLTNLAEDSSMRGDILKHNGVHALVTALAKTDVKAEATALLALARCMHDADSRVALSKEPLEGGIGRAIELLGSKDITVCRNAAYAISNAAQYEPNAVAACGAGALQAMINLTNDTGRNASKFATDALEKLLNYQLSAKYWLRSRLSPQNLIPNAFYDPGPAPLHPHHTLHFPSLSELRTAPLDTKREALLIDPPADAILSQLITLAQQTINPTTTLTPRQQLYTLAYIVSHQMGGPAQPPTDDTASMGHRFRMAEIKLQNQSNVIELGKVDRGTFYHRALLFKVLCDRCGVGPCELVRGEYGRAWNVVDVGRWGGRIEKDESGGKPGDQTLTTTVEDKSKAGGRPDSAGGSGGRALSSHEGGKRSTTGRHQVKEQGGGAAGGSGATAVLSQPAQVTQPTPVLKDFAIPPPKEDVGPAPVGPVIVDLMFEPGRLLGVGSVEAEAYQHLS